MSDKISAAPLLQKSISEPIPRKPTSRGKGFVRPNCATTFWLYCPVCCKRYFKADAHFECFTRWCEICQHAMNSADELSTHAQTYHRKHFCDECNSVYECLKGHRASEHPEKGKRKTAQSNTLMSRAKTTL